ncbi:MAG: choice-of-anchor D domain-containing protein, partial [Chloroflexaceae bacterium]|nr:choice-of-anchor D domain-containing protein [Chloroflexaceae bacterium]
CLPPDDQLVSPWGSLDIGDAAIRPGRSVQELNGAFATVCGAGSGIQGTSGPSYASSDSFQYLYRTIAPSDLATAGQFEVVVRLNGFAPPNNNAVAGLMLREAATDNARYVGIFSRWNGSATNLRIRQQARTTADGGGTVAIENDFSTTRNIPQWFRIVRNGNIVQTFRSTDGSTWTQYGSDFTLSGLNSTVTVGMAVNSATTNSTARGAFDRFWIGGLASPQTPPTANLTAPPNCTPLGDTIQSGWQTVALGNANNGKVVQSADGRATVCGRGSGIPSTNFNESRDNFRFLSRPVADADLSVAGNFVVTARMVRWEGQHANALSGIMIRNSTDIGSRFVGVFSRWNNTNSHFVRFLSRATDNLILTGLTSDISPNPAPTQAVPFWFRLVRTGNTVEAFYSQDINDLPSSWVSLGTRTLDQSFGSTVRVGIGTTMSLDPTNDTRRARAAFDNISIEGFEPVIPPPPAPILAFSPTSLDFGAQVVNMPSASRRITLSNTGNLTATNVALAFIGATPPTNPFSIIDTTCGTSLVPGASCTIDVVFQPTSTVLYSANLRVTLSELPTPPNRQVGLAGSGSTVGYASTPASGATISFGSVNVGSPGTATLEMRETGTADLVISSAVFNGGTPGDFAIAGPFPFTIVNGGAAVSRNITCTPSSSGPRSTVLLLTTNAGVQNYPLSCTGAQAAFGSTPNPGTPLDFGTILTAGSVTGNVTLQVRETGNAALNITAATITGPQASNFSIVSPIIPPTLTINDGGAAQTITLACNPSADGLREATLTLTTNATPTTYTYPLVCRGGTPGFLSFPWGSSPPASTLVTIPVADVQVGASASVNLNIKEDGNAPLTVNSFTLGGSHPGDYSVTTVGGFPFTINDGGNDRVIRLTCTPQANGTRTASLTLSTNVGNRAYNLSCIGRAPGFQTVPPPNGTLDIKIPWDQNPATPSIGTIMVNNIGTDVFTLTAVTIVTPPAIPADSQLTIATALPLGVPAGESRPVEIACNTPGGGNFSRVVQINYGSPTLASYTVICRKPAGPPQYASTPAPNTTINFGSINVGSTSPATVLTISNPGQDTLEVTSANITGPHASDFTLTRAQGFPFSIELGGPAQTAQLRCIPSARGTRTATLTVNTNLGPQTYILTCVGTGAEMDSAPPPDSTILVGTVGVGGSVQFTLPITNTGTANLIINDLEMTGPARTDFSVTTDPNTYPFTLASDQSRNMTITCTPSASNLRTAQLQINTNVRSYIYQLQCLGGIPSLDSDPAPDSTVAFGAGQVGLPINRTIQIESTGTADLQVQAATFTGVGAADYTIVAPSLPFDLLTINPPIDLDITCTPSVGGNRDATLTLQTNAGNFEYDLTCTGLQAVLVSTPPLSSTLDVGSALLNETTSTTLNISEGGNDTLIVSSIFITGTGFSALPTSLNIPSGGNQDVTVSCTPTTRGPITGTLNIASNAGDYSYPLECLGLETEYDSNPAPSTTIDFGSVPVNTTVTDTLAIEETGNYTLTVNSIGADNSVFSV